MRSRRKHRYRTGLIAVVAVVVLAVLAAGTFLCKKIRFHLRNGWTVINILRLIVIPIRHSL